MALGPMAGGWPSAHADAGQNCASMAPMVLQPSCKCGPVVCPSLALTPPQVGDLLRFMLPPGEMDGPCMSPTFRQALCPVPGPQN